MKKISFVIALICINTICSAQSWSLTGNAGTNPITNFLGTTDNRALYIRLNNVHCGRFSESLKSYFLGRAAGIGNLGLQNIGIGDSVLFWDSNGMSNIGIGYCALRKNVSKNNLVAIGDSALYNNSTGATISYHSKNNTAIGSKTLYLNSVGDGNTATGSNTMFSNTTGYFNTAMGYIAFYSNTTGTYNTAVGVSSLIGNTTGSNNTAIGSFSNVSANNLNNATAVGFNSIVNASNKVRIGSTAVTVIEGQVAWSFPSDGRFKKNVQENVPGLEFISLLRPVTYTMDIKSMNRFIGANNKSSLRDEELKMENENISRAEMVTYSGFVAQEVEDAAIKIGYNFSGVKKPQHVKDNYSLAYSDFVVPLVKAVQEMNKKIKEMEKVIEELKKKVEKCTMDTVTMK